MASLLGLLGVLLLRDDASATNSCNSDCRKIRGSWFNVDNSFSLGLHRVNQVVSARATYPDRPLPKISDVLLKYTNRKEPDDDEGTQDRKDTEQEAKVLFNVITGESEMRSAAALPD